MSATTTQATQTITATADAIWPFPIEVIGLTGEYASGKTLFGLTIDPKRTRMYDLEKSAGSYLSLGFDRVDVPAEMLRRHTRGYTPIDTYEWWLNDVRSIPPGRYSVIHLDPASEIETGLTEWVRRNPGHFGHTIGQYTKMSGIMWGDIKEHWKLILSDLASRCQTFTFTVHMKSVWSGDKPIPGKREAKGKETLMELASLFLKMERRADTKGNVPDKPAAIVLKSRLAATRLNEQTGDIDIVPLLPPRLPVATPHAIRQYMLKPPDYSKLEAGELAPEETLSEDDRQLMKLATAEAERDTESYRLVREDQQRAADQRKADAMAKRAAQQPAEVKPKQQQQQQTTPPVTGGSIPPIAPASPAASPAPQANGSHAADPPATGPVGSGTAALEASVRQPMTHTQAARLKELLNEWCDWNIHAAMQGTKTSAPLNEEDAEAWIKNIFKEILKTEYGVGKTSELSIAGATKLTKWLESRIKDQQRQDEMAAQHPF